MTQDDRQLDAVAKFLDGQNVRLDNSAQVLAADVRTMEQSVGKALDVAVPALAMERIRRQMAAALEQQALRSARPARHVLRRVIYVGSAMAAAAAIVLAVWAGFGVMLPKTTTPTPPIIAGGNPANGIDKPIDVAKMDPVEPRMDLLARQIGEMGVEMIATPAGTHLDVEIGAAEQALQSFYDNPVAPPPAEGPTR
jgi:hypothetical protein